MSSAPQRRTAPQLLSFPGEEARELWQCGPDGRWLLLEAGAAPLAGASVTHGIESMVFDSAPFWSLGADDGAAEAVALRWEGFGLDAEAGSQVWTHWPVAKRERHLLIATLALSAEAPELGPEVITADRFEPAALLLPLPVDGVALWREQGRFVAAFTRGASLVHLSLLSARTLDVEAAFELRDVYAALQAQDVLQTVAAIRIWTTCGPDFVPQLACLFDEASVTKEARPAPRLPERPAGLLPPEVSRRRLQQQVRRRRLLMIAAGALIYVCFFGAWWARLQWRGYHLASLAEVVAARQPEVDAVRNAQANWLEMEPALDPDQYPLEVYHQIVSLLPPEGIRLKELQIEGGKVAISGEATSPNHALAFGDKLKACQPLARYAWLTPMPPIREDNRADFRFTGTVIGEEAGREAQ